MKIIIEGCDGSGKSTLAKRLAKAYNLEIQHDSKPQDFKSYSQRLLDSHNIVFDRFFLGQFVYNKPEERKLTFEELGELVELCKCFGVVLIYLDTDKKTIMNRFANRSESERVKDEAMMARMGITDQSIFIDTVKEKYETVLKHCSSIVIRAKGVK